jgi:endonuclease-3
MNAGSVVSILPEKGKSIFEQPASRIDFTGISDADILLNNIIIYLHFFVLACVMDRQIQAIRSWIIPYKISKEIGGPEFFSISEARFQTNEETFEKERLHRFNNMIARNFYEATQRIHNIYSDNASNIWKDTPSSAAIVYRFLQFQGVGPKIETMAANILAREYKVPMSDYFSIDISVDTHVKRVFKRLRLVSKVATNDEVIYRARDFSPEFLGLFDLPCWAIGNSWCHARKKPDCGKCFMDAVCPKLNV